MFCCASSWKEPADHLLGVLSIQVLWALLTGNGRQSHQPREGRRGQIEGQVSNTRGQAWWFRLSQEKTSEGGRCLQIFYTLCSKSFTVSFLTSLFPVVQQKYFDSGDYNMAKAKMKNKQLPSAPTEKTEITGGHIPTPQDLPQRKTSIVTSKLVGWWFYVCAPFCYHSKWTPPHISLLFTLLLIFHICMHSLRTTYK